MEHAYNDIIIWQQLLEKQERKERKKQALIKNQTAEQKGKDKLYRTQIRSVITYATETAVINKKQEKYLRKF